MEVQIWGRNENSTDSVMIFMVIKFCVNDLLRGWFIDSITFRKIKQEHFLNVNSISFDFFVNHEAALAKKKKIDTSRLFILIGLCDFVNKLSLSSPFETYISVKLILVLEIFSEPD